MAFIPVANTAQLDIIYTCDSQRVENTLYARFSTAPDATQIADLAAAVKAAWIDNIMPLLSSTVSLIAVEASDLTSASGPQTIDTGGLPEAGGVTSRAMPSNVALCVSFRTGLRGRSFRGRNYLPGMSSDAVSEGVNEVNAAYQTSIRNAYLAVQLTIEGVGAEWVVVSRYADGSPRTAGVATPITNVVFTDNVVDSQRRRLPGRGA